MNQFPVTSYQLPAGNRSGRIAETSTEFTNDDCKIVNAVNQKVAIFTRPESWKREAGSGKLDIAQ
jgi:hypothetical protein